MTVSALIDIVMNFTEDINPTDSDYTNRRARILQLLQEVYDEVWLTREWDFSFTENIVVLTAGVTTLPEDFMEFGLQGGVYNMATRSPLREVFYQDINEARQAQQGGVATEFMISGPLRELATNSVDSTESLYVWYRYNPAILVDEDTAIATIPLAYHNVVLVNGVISRTRQSKGDARDWETRFQKGLALMIKNQKPGKTSTQRLPLQVRNW